MATQAINERFWSKVDRSGECWEWTGYRAKNGYGRFGVGQRVEYAHRVAYEMQAGPIPSGAVVMHRCDNRSCVRGDHLTVGTQADNLADMAKKGRRKGIRRYWRTNEKLTPAAVVDIQRRCGSGETHAAVAADYGVAATTVGAVTRGQTWSRQ